MNQDDPGHGVDAISVASELSSVDRVCCTNT
jgi:hypothetical protein